MSEITKCPYDSDKCPQFMSSDNEMKRLSDKMEIQNQYIIEKIDTIASDVKEVKTFLNEGLNKRIDERVNIALDKMQAKMFRWCLAALLGSGGLSALIATIIK